MHITAEQLHITRVSLHVDYLDLQGRNKDNNYCKDSKLTEIIRRQSGGDSQRTPQTVIQGGRALRSLIGPGVTSS
jgi:hypothetical protein